MGRSKDVTFAISAAMGMDGHWDIQGTPDPYSILHFLRHMVITTANEGGSWC
jgi:hypothetical protein